MTFRSVAAPVVALLLAGVLAVPHATAAGSTPPAPAIEPALARVAVGGEIAFDDLLDYVGAEIEVHTKIRTVRRGELEGFSPIAINLRLPASERGLLLGMPRESIAKVVLIADRPAKS